MIGNKEMEKKAFTEEMKKEGYTIVVPNMTPIHFNIMKRIFTNHGYKALLLENSSPSVIQEGLKYVHNDMCYPALLVIGQMIDAIHRGLVDKDRCALIISQTGGGCRASNYYFLLLKALERAGLGNIPVISANLQGMNSNPGFKITLSMLVQAYTALVYGDLIMLLSNQTRPYEINKGDTDKVIDKWTKLLGDCYEKNRGYFWGNMKKKLNQISDDFAAVPVKRIPKVKVGVVGEIYMKYSRLGNSNLQGFLEGEDCEVMLPPMMGFVFYCFSNGIKDEEYYGGRGKYAFMMKHFGLPLLSIAEKWSDNAVRRHSEFHPAASFKELEKYGKPAGKRPCRCIFIRYRYQDLPPTYRLLTISGKVQASMNSSRKPIPTLPAVRSFTNTSTGPSTAEMKVSSRLNLVARYMLRPTSATWVSGPRPSLQMTAAILLSLGEGSDMAKRSE